MSRNVRKKVTTPKRPKRRDSDTTSASSFDLSDDGGYSAVEDITDSEDDDEDDVDAVEEENIRTEATEPLTSPRPPTDDGNEEEDDDDDDDEASDQDIEVEVELSVDENIDLDDADEQTSWAGIVSDPDDNHFSNFDFYLEASAFPSDTAVERHVRFDVPSSDSDSTDTEDDHADLFPDIFVSQNSLDPSFRREIENDPDGSSDSGTFWDYAGQHQANGDSDAEEITRQFSDDETPTATPHSQQIRAEDMTPIFTGVEELDGYETDGDTTEEDSPEPPVRRKTRRPSVAISEMTDSESEPVQNRRGQPRLGRFKLDRSDKKPIAVLNPHTRKMMIFTPNRRHQLDLSPEQFNFPWPVEDQSTPLLSHSANMMLSAMISSNTFGDFVNPQTMGPAEAFFPFPTEDAADGNSSSVDGDGDGDDDDAEKNVDINAFVSWDGSSSSDNQDETGNWEPSSTPMRPTTASSEIDVLSHLNPETVGAFRRNQINQQLILSNQATQDSLAFSGPYNYTALKGLKSDRFDTAGIPLTPVRRHKKRMSDMARSPLEKASAKRKASAGDDAAAGHKRQRSISEVNLLRI